MSVDGDYGDDMGHDLGLDDEAVERLLTGDVADLVPVDQLRAFVTAVRGLSICDVPRPSAELSALLNGATGSHELATVTPMGPSRRRRRVMVASLAALMAGSVVSAAAAEVLPSVVQRPVAAIINALTPFDVDLPGRTTNSVVQIPVTVASTVAPGALPIRSQPTSVASTVPAPTTVPVPIPSTTTLSAPTTPVLPTTVNPPESVAPIQDKPVAPSTSIPHGRDAKDTLVKPEPVATAISGEVRAPKPHRKTKASKTKAAPIASPTPDANQPPPPVPVEDGNGKGNRKDTHPDQGATGDQNKSDKAKESGKPAESADGQPSDESNKSNGNSQQPDPPGKRADK